MTQKVTDQEFRHPENEL